MNRTFKKIDFKNKNSKNIESKNNESTPKSNRINTLNIHKSPDIQGNLTNNHTSRRIERTRNNEIKSRNI